ncbi:hypothetical protein MBUL_00684 [Methylobacterium bullatum]|uniref:Uncharacterized protein n=1 Tax=Methylobacterium bullatum TaxID=570505 RepID=A0A679IKD2_9HYPH|nr:hypothetical protein MBUL_00684 [Methylobacterium bullatum]
MSSRYTITIEKPFIALGNKLRRRDYFNVSLTMPHTKGAEIGEIPGCW